MGRPWISSTAMSAAFTPISRPVTPMEARAPAWTMASDPTYQGFPAARIASATWAAAGAMVLSAGVKTASTWAHSLVAASAAPSWEVTADSITSSPWSVQRVFSRSASSRAPGSSGLYSRPTVARELFPWRARASRSSPGRGDTTPVAVTPVRSRAAPLDTPVNTTAAWLPRAASKAAWAAGVEMATIMSTSFSTNPWQISSALPASPPAFW